MAPKVDEIVCRGHHTTVFSEWFTHRAGSRHLPWTSRLCPHTNTRYKFATHTLPQCRLLKRITHLLHIDSAPDHPTESAFVSRRDDPLPDSELAPIIPQGILGDPLMARCSPHYVGLQLRSWTLCRRPLAPRVSAHRN